MGQRICRRKLEKMSERMSEDMPENMPDRMPNRMPDKISNRMPEDMSEYMPEDMPDRKPENIPEHMPEDMFFYWMAAYGLGRAPYPVFGGYSGECVLFVRLGGTRSLFTRLRLKMREEKKMQKICQIKCQKICQKICQIDMPEDMSQDMPEDMPDHMPEDMSDRMPEDLPVKKYINVIVGMTRSKVTVAILAHVPFWLKQGGSRDTQGQPSGSPQPSVNEDDSKPEPNITRGRIMDSWQNRLEHVQGKYLRASMQVQFHALMFSG